jgi:hypothetical protein
MVRALLTMNAPPAALTVKGTDVPPAFVNVMFLDVELSQMWARLTGSPSGLLELLPYLARHRFCLAVGGRKRRLLRQVGHSPEFSLVLPRYEPEVEVRRALHHGQVVDALDPRGRLDRRDELVEDRTEFGTLGWRHLTEVQEMPSGLDDDRSGAGLLQRGVLGEEVLAFDDVAPRAGGVQEL